MTKNGLAGIKTDKLLRMKNMKNVCIIVINIIWLSFVSLRAETVIRLQPSSEDMTSIVRKAIDSAVDKDIKIIFEKGTYYFKPDYASDKYCFITNHENGLKKVIFPIENFDSVDIQGNGASLIFHGRVLPFMFSNCKRIDMKNLSVDWETPFTFQGEVMAVNKEEGWRDIKPSTEGFSWELKNGRIFFPNIDGFHFSSLGSTLSFDPETGDVAHGAWDLSSRPSKVEMRPGGIIRFYEKLKHYPKVGMILNSKGPKGENRYAPAVHVLSSKNITLDSVIVHHALGMGFLMEKTENASLLNCGVYVAKDSKRVVSTIADATHFCNCKGKILVQDCRLESMLDDGTNVHGTYVVVDEVLDDYTLRYGLEHFQQLGFDFASRGDQMWFIHQPNPERGIINRVSEVNTINDKYTVLRFKDKLPKNLKKGDILENKTWNPTFVMRGCSIQHHRARNIVIKTPEKIVIENNTLSSMMSSILFRGESYYWFESGAVKDVLIRNNEFKYCAYSGSEHAVMYVTPRLGKNFDSNIIYDRNIRFENNKIETFDNRIVIADRVDG